VALVMFPGWQQTATSRREAAVALPYAGGNCDRISEAAKIGTGLIACAIAVGATLVFLILSSRGLLPGVITPFAAAPKPYNAAMRRPLCGAWRGPHLPAQCSLPPQVGWPFEHSVRDSRIDVSACGVTRPKAQQYCQPKADATVFQFMTSLLQFIHRSAPPDRRRLCSPEGAQVTNGMISTPSPGNTVMCGWSSNSRAAASAVSASTTR